MKAIYWIAMIVAIIAALILGMEMQDEPSPGEKVEDAAGEISEGFGDAAQELDPNRSPMEKLGDAVEETGENIQDATTQ